METEIITSLTNLIQTANQVDVEIVLFAVLLLVVLLFILMTRRIVAGWLDTIKSLDRDRAAERKLLQGFLEDGREIRKADLERSAAITDSLKEMTKIDLEVYAKIASLYDSFVRVAESSSSSLAEIIDKADHNASVLSDIKANMLVRGSTPQAVTAVLNRRGMVVFQEDGTVLSKTPVFDSLFGRKGAEKSNVKDFIGHIFDTNMRQIDLESFLAQPSNRPRAFVISHPDGYLFWCYVHYAVIKKTNMTKEFTLVVEVIDWRVLDTTSHVRH